MKKKLAEEVWSYVDNEGFDYCFRNYSSFQDIKDEKFHELREAYKKAADELENYITKNLDF